MVVNLVEIRAGLLPSDGIDLIRPVAVDDLERDGRHRAAMQHGLLRQSLLHAGFSIAAFVDSGWPEQLVEDVDDHVGARGDALGQELQHQIVGVAIDDQPRQPVGLGVDQAAGAIAPIEAAARAMLDRPRDAPAEERLVEPFSLVPAEQAHADLRAAAPGAARQPGAAGGMDVDGIATTDVAGHACDRAREDPWMALLHGPFLAFGQDDCCHDSSSVRPACAGMRSTDAHPAVAAPTQAA